MRFSHSIIPPALQRVNITYMFHSLVPMFFQFYFRFLVKQSCIDVHFLFLCIVTFWDGKNALIFNFEGGFW